LSWSIQYAIPIAIAAKIIPNQNAPIEVHETLLLESVLVTGPPLGSIVVVVVPLFHCLFPITKETTEAIKIPIGMNIIY